jgi:PAS domain S-box-containing protein/putative nucleotidyltransferase with HDIG domain
MSESLLPVIIDAIADGIFVADARSRRILLANPAMCRLAGIATDAISNRDFADILASAARADGVRQFNAMANTQALTPIELLLQRPDGTALPVTLTGAPFMLNEHSLVVGVIHDVSPEHLARVNLRESEQTLRTIIESVSDGIIVHALDSGAFIDANPRACEMFGYTREELVTLDVDTLTAERSRDSHSLMLAHTARAASGEAHVFDWHVRAKDGRDFWVEVGLRRVTLGGRDYLLSTAHDITERKRATQALTYRDRLLHATTLGTAALVAAETLEMGMPQALRIVGEALGVDRALVIAESGSAERPQLHSVWEHPTLKVHMNAARFDDPSVDPNSLVEWLKPLRAGEQVVTHIETASAHVRDLMSSLSNQSMLLVPIFVGSDYWGNIGLDSCRSHREWNTTDAEVLRTFASVIGIAILRNRTQLSLRTSEAQISEALNMAKAGGWEYDILSDQFTFNDHFYRAFRTNARSAGGYRMSSKAYAQRFLNPQDIGLFEQAFTSPLDSTSAAAGRELELRVVYGDGTSGTVMMRLFTITDARGQPIRVRGVTQDITDRKRSEETLRRANRSLLTLSVGSETLVRSQNEPEFLDRMCEILIETGGYQTALLGLVEHDTEKTVKLAAFGGANRKLFERAHLTWEDVEAGRGPIGVAIRTGKVEINRDFRANPNVTMWRRLADELSYGSSIALPLRDHSDVFGVLAIYAKDLDAFNTEEVQLLTEFSNNLSFGITSIRSKQLREEALARLRGAMTSTVQALASTLERRDPYTAGHQRAVAKLASEIATRLHVSPADIEGISLAATIHDIGKIQIPTEILSKPGRLTPLEHQIVQTHAQAGYEIVQGVDFPWPIAEMILQHHERLNGSGYPRGLKGSDIILGARIIAVADVVESMVSHRPYRPALGLDPALAEIERGRGTLYDDAVVGVCIHLFREEHFSF